MTAHRAALSGEISPPANEPSVRPVAREGGARFDLSSHPPASIQSVGRPILGFVIGVILAFGFGLLVGSSGQNPRLDALPELPSMSQCMTDTRAILDLKQPPTP